MNISHNWLCELVDFPQVDLDQPTNIVQQLINTGTVVEEVVDTAEGLSSVVTAKILKKEHHPDSDHLWVTTVDVGADRPLQIVCGAQNFNEGDCIVTAQVGSVLPGDFVIKKSKLRGVVSEGMNCSARELGLGDDHDGILILDPDTPVGIPYMRMMGKADLIYKLEVTPNRADCMSMVGIAREVSALYETQTHIAYPEITKVSSISAEEVATVGDVDSTRCDRYAFRVLTDVQVGPSPAWLKERIEVFGTRSVNNVVDITNYVMFFLGQPMHAFDLDKVEALVGAHPEIGVRPARTGEQLVTLDGVRRTLTEDMTVVTANDIPIALAGVMGGQDTEVDEHTTRILLESALFAPGHTSRTSRNLQLFSESSMRFERIVSPLYVEDALNVAAALLNDLAEATCLDGIVSLTNTEPSWPTLQLRTDRLRTFVGAQIDNDFIVRKLQTLGCVINPGSRDDLFEVITYRSDLTREIDLYEEVLRLYGMQQVISTIPAAKNHAGGLTPHQVTRERLANLLRAQGLYETVTFSLVSSDDIAKAKIPTQGKGYPVELVNPMSSDQDVLRQSLLPGLLRSVAYNQAHQVFNVQLYELGTVFYGKEGKAQPTEVTQVCAVMAGSRSEQAWNHPSTPLDFYDAKGAVMTVLEALHIPKLRVRAADASQYPHLFPGRIAEVLSGGTILGWVGEIHPQTLKAFDIKGSVVAFELNEALVVRAASAEIDVQPIPAFPPVTIDLALVVDEEVTYERVSNALQSAGGKLLESVHLFDVYRDDERVGKGKKSLAFALTYRAEDRTLSAQEVEKLHAKVITKASKACGAQIRA